MTTLEIITTEDLRAFREELLNELKEALKKPSGLKTSSQYLKSSEVRAKLKVSANTLQTPVAIPVPARAAIAGDYDCFSLWSAPGAEIEKDDMETFLTPTPAYLCQTQL